MTATSTPIFWATSRFDEKAPGLSLEANGIFWHCIIGAGWFRTVDPVPRWWLFDRQYAPGADNPDQTTSALAELVARGFLIVVDGGWRIANFDAFVRFTRPDPSEWTDWIGMSPDCYGLMPDWHKWKASQSGEGK